MNPALLYFASGESLYSGAGLMLVMVAISSWLTRSWQVRLRNVITWIALAMMVMACPPFAWIVDAMFGAAFFFWFIAWNKAAMSRIWLRARISTMVLMFLLLLALPAVEWSHRRMPVITGEASDHLVVIGDSISAGLGARLLPWPSIMQQTTKLNVRNLSQPGATMSDGMSMAEKVNAGDRLVLIELGGNDLIAGESSDVFGEALNTVLARLSEPGRTMVMFELPLLPDRIPYGQIQRRICAKYRVWLIPKRFLTGVIAGHDATSDGLHLTDIGAWRMEEVVTRVLLPVLKTRSDKPITLATHP